MSLFDGIYIMSGFIAVVIVATIIINVYHMYVPIFASASNTLTNNDPRPIAATIKIGDVFSNVDTLLFFCFVFLEIVTIVLAAGLNSNPIGFAVGFVFLIFLVFLATIVSNAAYQIFSNPSLSATAQQFLPQSLSIIAQMPMWQFFFMSFYLLIIAARSIFWKQEGQQVVQYER